MLNKRGNALSIIFFFAVVVSIFIVSLVIMSFTNKILTPFSDNIQNVSAEASKNVDTIQNGYNQWWDYAVVLMFFINVILLFISSFLVDVHPAFLVIYIICLTFLFIFGISVMGAVQSLWNTDPVLGQTLFADAVAYMPITAWIIDNFSLVLLGIAILSGVIMYSKIKFFGSTAP